MSCGTFDIGCKIGEAIAPYLFWIQLGLWVVVGIVVLVVLALLRQSFGWAGVVAGIVSFVGAFAYFAGRRSVTVARTSGGKVQLSKDTLMALQRALAARQMYPGDIDGKFGAQSQAGMKAFQRQRGEKQTGFPTYDQLRDLGINLPRQ